MAKLTAEKINLERLKSAVGQEIFDLGQAFFLRGATTVGGVGDLYGTCWVYDEPIVEVEIRLSDNYLLFKCSCNTAIKGLICEHGVAAAMALQETLRRQKLNLWKVHLNQVLQEGRATKRHSKPQPYLLFFSLQRSLIPSLTTWTIQPYHMNLSALPQEIQPANQAWDTELLQLLLQNTPDLTMHLKTSFHSLNPAMCINCPLESVGLANLLIERARASYYSINGFPLPEYLALIASSRSPLFLGDPSKPTIKVLQVLSKPGKLMLEVNRSAEGLHLKAKIFQDETSFYVQQADTYTIYYSPGWVLADRYLFPLEDTGQSEIVSNWLKTPEVDIPARDEAEFLEKYYLSLAEQIQLVGEVVTQELLEAEPVCRLYLSEGRSGLEAELRFGYREFELPYEARLPDKSLRHKPGSWALVQVQRRPDLEEQAFQLLSSSNFGLKRSLPPSAPGRLMLRARVHPVDFLMRDVPLLTARGFEIYGEEGLKTARVNRNTPTLLFHVASGIDWFDVKIAVNFGEMEVDYRDIRRALRKKERYVRLADETIGEIPQEWIERYRQLFYLGKETRTGVQLSRYHLGLVDQLISGADRTFTDPLFEHSRQRLHSLLEGGAGGTGFSGITASVLPRNFTGDLRPYQKSGYDWLHFLHELEFGGCLADDMGLGKTVQVLVFLQSLQEGCNGVAPPTRASLAVVPRSLLVNWQREAARFTPNLRLLVYFDKDRIKDLSNFDQFDLVLTTYGVMLRDISLLRQYRFHLALLDESQKIKNPLAQTARAARQLQAEHRLVLTGTPVENSSLELWSQFAFLNPGLLGSLEFFRTEFGTPIEKKKDEQAVQLLRKMVYPFILRRTKSQVAPELPPRTERILYCDMEPAQRKLYNRTCDHYRSLLMGMLNTEGLNNSHMRILEGLLRLRQICNHPLLVDEKFRGDSGKFELLLDTLQTLRAEGHKALVFSQFVQMLSLVRIALEERKIPYVYLDGQTHDRQGQVDRFQNEAALSFFLISLKAGGLGLNLTSADYVIHIDPWWNPAVEMQASDRTHRIGQDKPVFVFKLITRDSVEEKILLLQERKKSLVEQLVTTESSFFKELTVEDVKILFS